jgi:hypothetical protein
MSTQKITDQPYNRPVTSKDVTMLKFVKAPSSTENKRLDILNSPKKDNHTVNIII